MRNVIIAVIAVVAITGMSGCTEYNEQHAHNTKLGPRVSPSNVVIDAPYHYPNVVRECVSGDGIYVTFKGTTVTVVPNDPACTGK